ncbi:MAG: Spy/CpxP family protein refolding chaperone [Chromatiales bacterium]|jgi:Spy/CpxP family protein refolding chaperone
MKPIKKRIAIFGLSALLISATGAALACGGPKGHHGHDRDNSPMAALSQLEDLTDEQKDQLREIRKTSRKSMRDLRRAMHDNRDELHDAMDDNADLETIRRLANKQGEQTARMIVLRAEIRDKINTVLSEAQQKQLSDLRDQGKGFDRPRNEMDQRPAGGDSRHNRGCANAAPQKQFSGPGDQGRGCGQARHGMNQRPACGAPQQYQRCANAAPQAQFYGHPYQGMGYGQPCSGMNF